VAVGSRPLFDEYERKAREIGTRFDLNLDAEDAQRLRRQMEAICVAAAPPFPPDQIPAFTSDWQAIDGGLLAAALAAPRSGA
jgi:hypothetical protein